jgi:broad specificity phosphatase PhoE
MSELYLVRHAQASFEAASYDDLSQLGITQSRLLGQYFTDHEIEFDGIVSGEMQRHRQTIEVLREFGNGTASPLQTHAGLNEYDFRAMMTGFCEDQPDHELVRAIAANQEDRKAYFRLLRCVLVAWSENQLVAAPESWPSFRERVADARAALQAMAKQCERVLVVSSGGAISMFLGSVLNLSPNYIFDLNLQIMNTSITRFFMGRSSISLAEFNATPHLASPAQARFRTHS